MSQDSRFRFDDILDNDPASSNNEAKEDGQGLHERYPAHGNVRYLGFVWEDGRRLFLNYAYLVSGEYNPSERTILLGFTSHEARIKGIFLDGLYEALMAQITRLIVCQDARYNSTADKGEPRVNAIEVIKLP